MFAALKKYWAKLPIPRFRADVVQVSQKTSVSLRQLIRRYQRQKRLWIHIILSSISLMVLYVVFFLLWVELSHGGGLLPAAWIILAGVTIAIYQVRRCNQVIRALRQAYVVQFQIEKAEIEREIAEQNLEPTVTAEPPPREVRPSSNGSQAPHDEA